MVAVGCNEYGQCMVGAWRDVVAIAAGCAHTVALTADGTVVAAADNEYGQCDVRDWHGIQLPARAAAGPARLVSALIPATGAGLLRARARI